MAPTGRFGVGTLAMVSWWSWIRVVFASAVVVLGVHGVAHAQDEMRAEAKAQNQSAVGSKVSAKVKPVLPPPPSHPVAVGKLVHATNPALPPMPSRTQLALIVQTFMVALSQATLTDNYSVLLALSTPKFQSENSTQSLLKAFAWLRRSNIDLTPIILYAPTLVQEPMIAADGSLKLIGYYKTAPKQVHFAIVAEAVDGAWRLAGLSLETKQAPPMTE